MTILIAMEKIIRYQRKWLSLPERLNSIALYGPTSTLQLLFKRLTEEYMVTKTREVIMFKKSKEPRVVTAGIEVCTGRRWNASFELQKKDWDTNLWLGE